MQYYKPNQFYGPSLILSGNRDEGVLPAPSIFVWDQCLKFGTFRKKSLQGEMTTTVFDEETVGQMMDYFADHENDLWMDSQHGVLYGKGQALCYHNALVMVSQGKVVRFEAKGEKAPQKPTIEDLRRPSGNLPTDGLYAYRYQLTSLGLDPKEGIRVFKWVSPFFEQTSRGYRLINITATNDPFLDGVSLAYDNTSKLFLLQDETKEHVMENEMQKYMEASGCKAEDPPEEKLQKLTAYMKKMEAEKDKALQQMESEKKPTNEQALSAKKMESEEKIEEDAKEKKEDEEKPSTESSMARSIYRELGLPVDPEMAKEKIQELRSLPRQLAELRKRMEASEHERAQEKKRALQKEADAFAESALLQKRWRADHKGSEEQTKTWLAQAFMRDAKEAEEMLQPPGTFGLSSSTIMERYTKGGAPYGVEGRAKKQGVGLGTELNQAALRIQKQQEDSSQKPFSYERALALAERQHPHLAHIYSREVFFKENESWD